MTDTRPELGTLIQNALNSIHSQLTGAEQIATGPAGNIIRNLLDERGLLAVHFNNLLEAANDNAREFNELMDEVNALDLKDASAQSELLRLTRENQELAANAAEAEADADKLRAGLNWEKAQHKKTVQDAIAVGRRLNGMQQVEADNTRLKTKLTEKQSTIEELRTALAEQRTRMNEIRVAKADSDKKRAALVETAASQQEYIAELTQRLNYTDETTPVFNAEDGAKWYFHTFGWGLVAQQADRELIQTNWHIELRDSNANGAMVMVDEFLEPVIPNNERTRTVPGDMMRAVRNTIRERCRESHPDLYARREWAANESVTALALPPALISKLEDNYLLTLLSVLRLTQDKLALYKGFGPKTAQQVIDAARVLTKAWMKQYDLDKRSASKKTAEATE